MSIAYFARQIQPGEKIKRIIYKSPLFYIIRIAVSIVFIWGSLFSYFWLEKRMGSPAFWLVLVLVAYGVFSLLNFVMKIKYTAWVITNERLLDFDQKNFWRNEINESSLSDLARPQIIKRGWLGFLLGLRTIRVFLTEEKAYLEIEGVKNDKDLAKFLNKVLSANELTYDWDED